VDLPALRAFLGDPEGAVVEAGERGFDGFADFTAGFQGDAVARVPGTFDDALQLFCLHGIPWGWFLRVLTPGNGPGRAAEDAGGLPLCQRPPVR